jgi:hypothetical protein
MNQPPPIPPTTAQPQKTSGLAIASLIFGIISLLGGALFIIPILLAVILGHMAVSRCNRDPEVGGKGLAIAGLATGYASILFAGLMAAMAVPAFKKVRENAFEKTLYNDAIQIGSAAQQLMIENPGKPVSFTINNSSGAVMGDIAPYISEVLPGTTAPDNVISHENDGFSLQHPMVKGGAVFEFDAQGRLRGTR